MVLMISSIDLDGATRAISVDPEGTRIREDAFIITENPEGGWCVSILVPYPKASAGSRIEDMGWKRNGCFVMDEASPAMLMDFMVSKDGAVSFVSARTCECILERAYSSDEAERIIEAGKGFPSLLRLKEVARSIMLERGASRTSINIQISLAALITACSAAAAAFMSTQGRKLLYVSWERPGAQRVLSLSPLVHAHWNFTAYARFTSPLRRREDKINLACLLAASMGLREPFDPVVMERERLVSAKTIGAAPTDPMVSQLMHMTSQGHEHSARALRVLRDDAVEDMSSVAFRNMLRTDCKDDFAPHVLECEFMRRLRAGMLASRDVAYAVSHSEPVFSLDTREAALSIVRGSTGANRYLPEFLDRVGRRLGYEGKAVVMPAEEDVDGAWTVECSIGTLRAVARADTADEAATQAMGRLAAVVCGLDPDAPVDTSGVMRYRAELLLKNACVEAGFPPPIVLRTSRLGIYRAMVTIDGLGEFEGVGPTKMDAHEEACEVALREMAHISIPVP